MAGRGLGGAGVQNRRDASTSAANNGRVDAVLMRGHCRYEKEFEQVQDVFELQRNLNNAFAYDLVPSPTVITAALRAARRVNDFPTAVRIFEGASTADIYLFSRSVGVANASSDRHQGQSGEPDAIR